MAERRRVEPIAARPPVGQVLVHQLGEALAVPTFEEVGHLVDGQVLQAVRVLLRQLQVEPDVAGLTVAGAPLGLHAADAPLRHRHADRGFPLRQDIRDRLSELLPVPTVEEIAPSVGGGAFGHVQQQPVAVDLGVGSAMPLDDLETESGTPDEVRLPSDHLPDRLAFGSLHLLALTLDPRQTVYDRQSHLIVVEAFRRSDAYAPEGWVHADVQVLDVLEDDVHVDAGNGQVGTSGTHCAPSPVQTTRRVDRSRRAALPGWPA